MSFLSNLLGRISGQQAPEQLNIPAMEPQHYVQVTLSTKYDVQLTEEQEGLNLVTYLTEYTGQNVASHNLVIVFPEGESLYGDAAKAYVVSKPYPVSVTTQDSTQDNG